MLTLMKKHIRTKSLLLVGIGFQIVLILFSFATIYGQNEEYYTIIGRVIDENGKPNSDAGIWVVPVKYNTTTFYSFDDGFGTDTEGRFIKKVLKNELTNGRDFFLFISVDTNSEAMTTVDPPFVWIREHDKSYDGQLI